MDMKSSRSIVCSSILSKHHHKFLRSRQDTQRGGIPEKRVDMSNPLMRSFMTCTKAMKSSALIICYDIRTAFYFVMRQMLLLVHLTRQEYLDVLDSVEIPIALVTLLELPISKPALVPEVTSDQHLVSILSDAHQHTRFPVQDVEDVAVTSKGTRPSDSLADLVFSVLLSTPVLSEACSLSDRLGLVSQKV